MLHAWLRAGRASGTVHAFSRCARMLIQIAIMGGRALLVIEQTTTSGVMLAGTLLLARALAPVETAIGGWKALVEARAAYRRLDALLATRQAVPPPRCPRRPALWLRTN